MKSTAMKTRTITELLMLAGLVVYGVLAATQSVRAAERDVYDYAAQRAAPAGTRRIVFIASKAAHGPRGNHEFFAGSLYFARRINAVYPRAYAVVYGEDQWPT